MELNQTQADYPDTALIHEQFEAQVKDTPEAMALVFEDTHLTYKQLNEQSNQLAHYLIAQGIKPDTLVGLCVERSLAMVIGILGILKAGGAYVPLDPQNPSERLLYQIEDAELALVLTQRSVETQLPRSSAQSVCMDSGEVLTQLRGYSSCNPNAKGLKSDHLALSLIHI